MCKNMIVGSPANIRDVINPDWAPNQHMGYTSVSDLPKSASKRLKVKVHEAELAATEHKKRLERDKLIKIEAIQNDELLMEIEQSTKADQCKPKSLVNLQEDEIMNCQFNLLPQSDDVCRLCLNEFPDYAVCICLQSFLPDSQTTVAQSIEALMKIQVKISILHT